MPQKKKRKAVSISKDEFFFKKYNFEITVVSLIGFGIFLILEKMEIKHYIFLGVRKFFFTIGSFIKLLIDGGLFIISQFETSDLVGIILILIAVVMVATRWRHRIIERHSILSSCPQCGSSLKRIKRRWQQRLKAAIYSAEVKRYSCKNCTFVGVKMAYHSDHH